MSNYTDHLALTRDAYTSYVTNCGDRAAECAKADLLGQALEALKKLLVECDRPYPTMTANGQGSAVAIARAVLAQAKGTP